MMKITLESKQYDKDSRMMIYRYNVMVRLLVLYRQEFKINRFLYFEYA